MVRRFICLIGLFFMMILPIKISALDGIPNYYIFATVLSNGDVNVREIFNMNGSFNGINRIINYAGATRVFDGSMDSFKGSDIYNGDSIIVNEIKGIPFQNSINVNDLNKIGTVFRKVDYADKGEYGVYTIFDTNKGVSLFIYNPSSYNNAFYIDYTITNMAIVHNDVAELGFNIFTELKEYVENLEMYIQIPNNQDMLKVWAHGPLSGESEIIDEKTVKVSIQKLQVNTPIDTRIVFDKSVLSESHKYSNTDALGKIVYLETKQAELANQEHLELQKKQAKKEMYDEIFNIGKIIWIVALCWMFYKVYSKYDKEYKSEFSGKYFRDFPSDNTPATVDYLIHKDIKEDALSASILMLISNKVLSFKQIEGKSKDYILAYQKRENISVNDKRLLEFLYLKSFEAIQDKEEISLSSIKRKATSNYGKLLGSYTSWNILVKQEAIDKHFFEQNTNYKILPLIYNILGIFFSLYTLIYVSFFRSLFLSLAILLLSIIFIIYLIKFTKRNVDANHEYHKWMGLKKFMEDFGTMDKKDLPDVVLWEKYLVYALVLGCADKLEKSMKIRVKEFTNTNISDINFDFNRVNSIVSFNRSINHTVISSMNNAHSAYERDHASSSSSSGSGSGGGFSSGFSSGGGGGSFGGGGGGGRF